MDTGISLSQSDYQALAEFRYQLRRFQHFSEKNARAAGLEPQQHQLLLVVKGIPPNHLPTIGEIAERLQIQHHSAVELVTRLVDRGLIERQRDEEDRRKVIVYLTTQGETILQKLAQTLLMELQTTGPALVKALSTLLEENP